MKSKLMRKLLGGMSLTTALFVFQACYGGPQDYGLDLLLEGQVKSNTTGLPITGIRVYVENSHQYILTDGEGKFSFYTEGNENLTVKFEDIDSDQNGLYENKDTVITNAGETVFLEITLEKK
jgi:putative lipoprotein (rSAM/lipoprotein system)